MSDIDRLTMTVDEVARALGVRRTCVLSLIDQGLPVLQIGRRRRVVKASLHDWLAAHADDCFEAAP